MATLDKVVNPGRVAYGLHRTAPIFCHIQFGEDGKLSIDGVIGPKRNGGAAGSCGQIVMEWRGRHATRPPVDFAKGWSADLWERFLSVWDRWHLNDLRAGCEHQRANWEDPGTSVYIYHWTLTSEALREQGSIKRRLMGALERGESVQASPAEAALLGLPFSLATAEGVEVDRARYEPRRPGLGGFPREEKAIVWLRPEEHPRGLLCRPCEVCGYKYGSAWLREEVPAEVVEFLRSLPESELVPAWV